MAQPALSLQQITYASRIIGGVMLWKVAKLPLLLAVAIDLVLLLPVALAAHAWSWWWLLFLVPLLLCGLVVAAVWLVIWSLHRALLPAEVSRQDQRLVAGFSDKVIELLERAKTPLPILVLRILWDVVRRKDVTVVRQAIQGSRELQTDLVAILAVLRDDHL